VPLCPTVSKRQVKAVLVSAMVAGLAKGLSHADAPRLSFLLATPVILVAGVLLLPDLAGPLGDGIRPQIPRSTASSRGSGA
jgi:undecaprenyl-diphosphatase